MPKTKSKSKSKKEYYSGLGGAKCDNHDILKATSVVNSLADTSGWGNQVSAAIAGSSGKVRFACAAEHITGPYKN
jgi:hypothetical protein